MNTRLLRIQRKYKDVFDYPGKEVNLKRFLRALGQMDFDYRVLIPHLNGHKIDVTFGETYGNFGWFNADKLKLKLMDGLYGTNLAATVHHELFHAIDCVAFTYDIRLDIWRTFHPDVPPTGSSNVFDTRPWVRDGKAPNRTDNDWGWLGYGQRADNPDWWEKQVGEISAEAFTVAHGLFATSPEEEYHPVTPAVLDVIKKHTLGV